MKIGTFHLWIVGFLLLGIPNGAAGTMDDTEEAPYERCGYCHSIDGNSVVDHFPKIAELPRTYIVKQIYDFRSGARGNDRGYMQSVVELLSPEDIDVVADYFSRQKRSVTKGGEDHTVGRRLYSDGRPGSSLAPCTYCHSAERGAFAPSLAGQNKDYLIKQLEDYRDGRRANDDNGVMRDVAQSLTAQDIAALAAYLSATNDE